MSKKPPDPKTTSENLERIARALDRPVSVFYDTKLQTTHEAETLALVTAFKRITDSHIRAKCIAFVNAEVVWEAHD